MLIADWTHASKAIKTCLLNNIHRVISTLTSSKNHSSILQQCRLLESVVNKPWEDEVLNKIFNSEEVDIDGLSALFTEYRAYLYNFNSFLYSRPAELIDYFHSECATVIIVRLEILLDSKCEDFAIRLSKSFLWAYHCTDPLEFDLDQNQLNYITDIYYCCLFKRKNRTDLVSEVCENQLPMYLTLIWIR